MNTGLSWDHLAMSSRRAGSNRPHGGWASSSSRPLGAPHANCLTSYRCHLPQNVVVGQSIGAGHWGSKSRKSLARVRVHVHGPCPMPWLPVCVCVYVRVCLSQLALHKQDSTDPLGYQPLQRQAHPHSQVLLPDPPRDDETASDPWESTLAQEPHL